MNEYQEIETKKKQLEAEIQAWQTERETFRQTVQEWRDSKEGWQLILRGGNDGIWDWDVKKNELFLSPRWKEMLGYTDQELPNHFDTWKRLLHPNDLDKSVDALQAYLNKIIPEYCIEFRLRCKDGNYKWILSRGQALWDEQGVAIRMAGSHTDISERKEEQTLLRSLIDCIPDMVFYKDCQGVYKICNNAFEEYIGQKSSKIVGFTDFDLYLPVLAEFFREQDRNIMNEKTSRRTEDWISDNKGHQRLFETIKTPLIGMDGKYMGVIGVGRDITERQEREKALQREAQKDNLLRRIAGKLMVQAINAAINKTLAAIGEFTGSERSYIIQYTPCQRQWSMMYEWCNPLHPQIKPIQERSQNLSIDIFPWFSGQLLSGKSVKINSLEDIPDEASSEKKTLETSLTPSVLIVPMLDGTNKTVGYLGLDAVASKHWTSEDISLLQLVGELIAIAEARNNAETALKQAKETADSANRAKSEFLANMSHELRTPLNAILGFTQVLSHSSFNQQQQEYLAIINRSGEHLLELINDILEMSKIEAGKAILNQNNFDLYRLLDNLEAMLRLKAQAKNLDLIFERSSDIPQYIQTDEGKLRQVLINLLGNAIKFTNEGHVILRVTFIHPFTPSFPLPLLPSPPPPLPPSSLPSLYLRFEVEDTGPGIATKDVDKLFEAFTQTDVGRKSQQGTGLGLPISKKFIELMGGNIRVSSILGNGSLFAFDIRVQLADAQKIESEQPTHKIIGIEPNQTTYRILVVDDRAESRLLMVKLLSTMGFLVQQAANGQEAIEIWETWNPHLIWMDMRMPVMDGYEATRRIKLTPKGQKTVIIALTASAFEEDRTLVLSAGCDDFVRKPFKEVILWQKIAQHLGVRFIYENSPISNHALTIAATENQQLKTQLAQMPQVWLTQFQKAAYKCSDDEIISMIEQIPLEFTDLKTFIKELAHNFRFEAILDLLIKKE